MKTFIVDIFLAIAVFFTVLIPLAIINDLTDTLFRKEITKSTLFKASSFISFIWALWFLLFTLY